MTIRFEGTGRESKPSSDPGDAAGTRPRFGLGTKILIGMVVGAAAGVVFRDRATIVEPVGDLFIRLLMMAAIPLVFFNLLAGLTALTDLRTFGRLSAKIVAYYLVTTATALTLGLAYPAFVAQRYAMVVGHSRYGSQPFTFEQAVKRFYGIYVRFLGLLLLVMVPGFFLVPLVMQPLTAGMSLEQSPDPAVAILAALLPLLILIPAYLIAGAYLKAAVTNLVFHRSRCGEHRFDSTLEIGAIAGLYLTNGLAIIFSLIGARIAHLITNPHTWKMHGFIRALFTSKCEGLVAYGGYIGGSLAGYFYFRAKKLDFWSLADCASPGLVLGLGFTRIGCFLAGCCPTLWRFWQLLARPAFLSPLWASMCWRHTPPYSSPRSELPLVSFKPCSNMYRCCYKRWPSQCH